ncbi:magnesium transporter [Candidatus Nitrosotenuis chungbukensis]|uniref:magnesium transporter n=1 Tax=Candidatus Nitrosotenuis chungbukensis TaxID=1353246 RepID=UPI000694C47A|nr:magnesium transporter [Candidatus Nitrosotenuis chungbukensis]WKT57869.1 magnesium transporter [Candidatus Nitrosotenuis chungbukensis]
MSSKTKKNNSREDLVDAKMTKKFLAFLPSQTVGEIEDILDVKAKEFETIGYVYAVDEKGVLVGVSSLKQVLQAAPATRLEEIMNKTVVSIPQHSHQERAVYVALKHGLMTIPVVDNEKHLMGVIPHNAILSIFHHEAREDFLRFGGIHHEIKEEIESLKTPATRLVRARLPSLFIGLLGGLIAAAIISNFESFLNEYLILASFIPVIVYLSDAIGTQSQTLVVRMLALEPNFSLRRYMFREIIIGSFLGFIFAASLFAAAFLGWGTFNLGIVIGASIFLSMISQAFFSTIISVLFEKFGIDPATSAGPIATIISDIMTISTYFGIAILLLNFLAN